MPTITALREKSRGRVAVELDGEPWRDLPLGAVVRAGLAQGRELDRPSVRRLRRELRRDEALSIATRALRARDLSERRLAERLDRAAVSPSIAAESLELLSNAGLVDDGRFAERRASSLAQRGYGDAAIRHDLERQGLAHELAETALRELEPEAVRAQRIVAARGADAKTMRYLVAKGFAPEALETAFGPDFANDP